MFFSRYLADTERADTNTNTNIQFANTNIGIDIGIGQINGSNLTSFEYFLLYYTVITRP